MTTTFSRALLLTALGLATVSTPVLAAPAPQHAGHHADALNAKLTARVAATDAKLTTARKAGRVSPAQAAQLSKTLTWVRTDSAKVVKQQGFLSAAESASYQRALDEVNANLG